ncbi:MAG: NAD-dependent DNA ligase LigA [Eubacteriales bacterium]
MDKEIQRIKELVNILNEASLAYYGKNEEIISNFEYDKLEDELAQLEKRTGIILSASPTQKVGGTLARELPRFAHESPMLSLAKTKQIAELADFLKSAVAVLSWKLDGLTVVLTYEDGKLAQAVTRGNGQIGELVTDNAMMFANLPLRIPFVGKLVVRGEAIITYSQFEKINAQIEDVVSKYKNPRNLCSGSVRQLDSSITKKRGVKFYAFSLSKIQDMNFNLRSEELEFLKSLGFEVVEYKLTDAKNIEFDVSEFEKRISKNDFPTDGLVLRLNDIKYGESLGTTDKYPKDSIAFKWKDEIATTVLKQIQWSASRTGLLNPIAVFEPVELEGTTVSRASVHNVSIVRELKLGIGDSICVYKANMIIPQIAENITKSNTLQLPEFCPVCGKKVELKKERDVSVLLCKNMECPAKQIKSFTHFVSRNAMNVDGLSEASLEKFVDNGYIREFADIFKIERYKNEIIAMEGFGEKSFVKLLNSTKKASKTSLSRLLYSLGIQGIGVSNAKSIAKYFDYDIEKVRNADFSEFCAIDGVGDVLAQSLVSFFKDAEKNRKLNNLLEVLEIEKKEKISEETLRGKTFVITGSLEQYSNREELKTIIEELGGKVAGSVSKNTTCLVNNDLQSASSKNKKAKELGVPIISEQDFIAQFLRL